MKTPLALLFAFLLPLASTMRADVTLAPLFQDHAVLQQGMKVPIWGKSAPFEAITVSFRGQKVSTKATADGRWHVELEPIKFATDSADLTVIGKNTIEVHDVLVGTVWLCSGQSNMEFALVSSQDGGKEAASAKFPLIRHFKVKRAGVDQPADTADGDWKVCSPAAATAFTAVGYYFARDIYEKTGMPVGIIQSAVSGAKIEPWVSEDTLKSTPSLSPVIEARDKALAAFPEANAKYQEALAMWEKERDAAQAAGTQFNRQKPSQPFGPGHINFPTAFYNGMIHPLIPYALSGVLWYQGESNIGHVDEYRDLQRAFITQLRKDWKQQDLAFYFVQLPAFGPNLSAWGRFREAQACALELPNTGMAVTIDIGGDAENLHPKNKKDVGLRLARIAEAKLLGIKIDDFSGPLYRNIEKAGTACRISFDHASGLNAHGDKVLGFEIAGADNKFVPANAVIESGGTVLVSDPTVPQPVSVRYGWGQRGVNLYNAAGLPAAPFHAK